MQVFDNLYFVGNAGVSAWLLGSEDAYILIDAMNTDEDAKNTIEKGILELGLDPTRIEYLLITHAHGDHYGGYNYIKSTYGPRIVMSETDWHLASLLQEHPRFGAPPERDYSVVDGDTLTAGDTAIDIYVTPGHTMGTISPVFTVYDNGVPYTAVMWGGTGFNFGPNFDQMSAYAASAERMKSVAVEENIQVFLANHPRRDGSLERMARLKERGAADPHAFIDQAMVLAAFETLAQCATAQAYRIDAGDL
jgi:metallo-beta-lactamase class B